MTLRKSQLANDMWAQDGSVSLVACETSLNCGVQALVSVANL